MALQNPVAIELDVCELRAVARHAGVHDIRYYLNGVCVELGALESRLIATDGHRLALMRITRPVEGALIKPLQIIIPSDALKTLPKRGMVILQVLPNPEGAGEPRKAAFVSAGTRTEFTLIDGKFPDYRRVCAVKPSGLAGQYDPQLLLDFKKSAQDLGASKGGVTIHHNDLSSALVTIGRDDFIGVIMPIRAEAIVSAQPEWATGPLTLSQPEEQPEAQAA